MLQARTPLIDGYPSFSNVSRSVTKGLQIVRLKPRVRGERDQFFRDPVLLLSAQAPPRSVGAAASEAKNDGGNHFAASATTLSAVLRRILGSPAVRAARAAFDPQFVDSGINPARTVPLDSWSRNPYESRDLGQTLSDTTAS